MRADDFTFDTTGPIQILTYEPMFLRLAELIDRLSDLTGRAVKWLALVMVIVGAYNAVARYLDPYTGLRLSSNTWLELQWYLFGALFLLAAAWALRMDAHVRVDVFYGRLSPVGKAWVNLLGTILLLLPFCALMLVVSWSMVERSWAIAELSPDPGGLPRYPVRTLVPIGFALLGLQGVASVIRGIVAIRSGDAGGGGTWREGGA